MLLQFEGNVVRCLYNTPDYKIYSMDIDSNKYPSLHLSKYGTITITGNFQELESGIDYYISAEEVVDKKYGVNYKVHNISLKKPDSKESSQIFLSTILTPRQANTLLNAYPNIIQKIIDDDIADIDFTKLKGIKQFTFDIIKKKVVENFVIYELVDEFKQTMDFPILMKLYEKYNSTEKIKIELQADPYKCLTQISRVGFIRADGIIKTLYKKCNEMIKNGEKPPINLGEDFLKSPSRCLACVQYCIEEVESNGDTKIDLEVLLKKVQTLAKECSDKLVEVLKDKEQFYIDIKDKSVSLRSTYNDELYVAYKILDGLKIKNKWDCDIEKYRKIDDNELTNEQISAVKMVCDSNISILQGGAGCGKTFTTTTIIKMIEDMKKSYILMSPTGKSSQVLKNYTGKDAKTIHRALQSDGHNFKINLLNKLPVDLIVVDETSMCDANLFRHLVESIDFHKTKLLLIGDSSQIPSVSKGNIYANLIQSNLIPTTNLTKVFRYKEGGLSKVATDIRNSQYYLENANPMQVYGNKKDYVFFNIAQEDIVAKMLTLYRGLIASGIKSININVLSCLNKGDFGCDSLNKKLQVIANPKSLDEKSPCIKVGDTKYYEGDLIINTINDYKPNALSYDEGSNFIANGEMGIIQRIDNVNGKPSAIIKFHNTAYVFTKDRFTGAKLAYALSIYKMQGSQNDIIIAVTPKSHIYMLNNNLLYTGLTRAKKQVYHFSDTKTIKIAISKKADLRRQTNLLGILLNPPTDMAEQCAKWEKLEIKYYEEKEKNENKHRDYEEDSANDFLSYQPSDSPFEDDDDLPF